MFINPHETNDTTTRNSRRRLHVDELTPIGNINPWSLTAIATEAIPNPKIHLKIYQKFPSTPMLINPRATNASILH